MTGPSDEQGELVFRMLLAAVLTGGVHAIGRDKVRKMVDDILGAPTVEVRP